MGGLEHTRLGAGTEPGPADRVAGQIGAPAGTRLAARASHVRSRLLFMLLDAVAVAVAYGVAEVFWFRDRPPALYWRHLGIFILFALVLHLASNQAFGLYDRIWRHAGIEEARQVLLSVLAVLLVLVAPYPLWRAIGLARVPLPVPPIGALFLTIAMGALRFHSRLFAWQRGSRRVGLRVAVIGSRDAGAAAVREMVRSPGAGLVPVAVFDDDPHSHGRSLMGVPVVGRIDDLPAAAPRFMVQQVLLAVSNPPPELVERALAAAEAAGVSLKVLPSVREVVAERSHHAAIRQAREPTIEDLLGRKTVAIDLEAVEDSLAGQRVLITGAGGSIGSEIARQVAACKPAQLILLDHDETHLHDAAATVPGPCDQVLLDVADKAAMFEAFLHYRPDVVFHAAAHKHVPVLEDHPVEAARVNVIGTLNAVQAAVAVHTRRFVEISTDKAVRPANVMGASKRLGELIVRALCPPAMSYCSVRFGNVLGSRGSVIPTFARQIAAGGPVTVTDPSMTRFFMSVEEAVQLVLQASVLAEGGEVFVLEMGEPVRIVDLAERMIRLSGFEVGTDIPIQIIGRRPGEKLHEELHAYEEEMSATAHPSVKRLWAPGPPSERVMETMPVLIEATSRRDGALVRDLLFHMCAADQAEGAAALDVLLGNGHRRAPSANGNGHTNGNGHSNGHTNGNGHSNGNGHTNGNGHPNGNGHDPAGRPLAEPATGELR